MNSSVVYSPSCVLRTAASACSVAVDRHQTRKASSKKAKFFRRLQVLMMPGLGEVKPAKGGGSEGVVGVALYGQTKPARPDTFTQVTGWRYVSSQFTKGVVGGVGKGWWKSLAQTETQHEMWQLAVTPRKKLSKTFPSNARRRATVWGKKKKRTHAFVGKNVSKGADIEGTTESGRRGRRRGCWSSGLAIPSRAGAATLRHVRLRLRWVLKSVAFKDNTVDTVPSSGGDYGGVFVSLLR